MISHNAEFYEALCPEKWILESGRLTVMGAEWMEEVRQKDKKQIKILLCDFRISHIKEIPSF